MGGGWGAVSKAKPTGKKAGKPVRDWIAIRNEYASTDISTRELAEKYGISYNTVKDRASREKWAEMRDDQHRKITAKTQQETAKVVAKEEAGRVARLLRIADRLMDKTEQALGELDQQAVKHVEKVKTSTSERDDDGKPIRREVEYETVKLETINSIVDRRGLQQIANSAKAIKDILSATEAENDSGSLDDLIAALREIGGSSA